MRRFFGLKEKIPSKKARVEFSDHDVIDDHALRRPMDSYAIEIRDEVFSSRPFNEPFEKICNETGNTSVAKMSDPHNVNLPEDLLEHIMITFLPIKSVSQFQNVSKRFRDAAIWCQDLDFSDMSTIRYININGVSIIDDIFKKHEGSKLTRFHLVLANHIGVEEKILSWIKTCIDKNIQEIILDFSSSNKVINIPVDFSTIETLTVLKLQWCNFEMPGNSLKGLKLLRTLTLVKTQVTKEMINAIFSNCMYLETLELNQCRIFGVLRINAQNHKKFKLLGLYHMPNIDEIVLGSPTLECYKYAGVPKRVSLSRRLELKEAKLHYTDSRKVADSIKAFTKVLVLETTNNFLRTLMESYTKRRRIKTSLRFWNLKEFRVYFNTPTSSNLYYIVKVFKRCPKLERVFIDINGYKLLEPLYSNIRDEDSIKKNNDQLNTIKFVEIKGYEYQRNELSLVEFFICNVPSLKELILKRRGECIQPDNEWINYIKKLSPKKDLIKFVYE